MLFTFPGIHSRSKLIRFHSSLPCPQCNHMHLYWVNAKWRDLFNNKFWLNTPTALFCIWTGITRGWIWPTLLMYYFPTAKQHLQKLHHLPALQQAYIHVLYLNDCRNLPTLQAEIQDPCSQQSGEKVPLSPMMTVLREPRAIWKTLYLMFVILCLLCCMTHPVLTGAGETEWSETKTPHSEQPENIMFQHTRHVSLHH